MKKVFCILMCMVLLICVTTALASDTFEEYKTALKSKTWELKALSPDTSSKVAPNLDTILNLYKEISLTNNEIQLFEAADGKTYMTFRYENSFLSKGDAFLIAEIVFNEDMSAFILYSDGCAILFE